MKKSDLRLRPRQECQVRFKAEYFDSFYCHVIATSTTDNDDNDDDDNDALNKNDDDNVDNNQGFGSGRF